MADKEYRNIQEQVQKNKEDIQALLDGGEHGVKGDTGATGPQGPQGPQGSRGTGFFGTTDALPTASDYIEGDFYLLNNGNVYKKYNGAWVLMTNIKGKKGNSGTVTPISANPSTTTQTLTGIMIDNIGYAIPQTEIPEVLEDLADNIDVDEDGSVEFGHDVYADGNLQAGNDVEVGRILYIDDASKLQDPDGNQLIPTKTSDLVNDSGFVDEDADNMTNYYTKTQTYTKNEVDAIIAAIEKLEIVVAASLPVASASTMGKIYLTPHTPVTSRNTKDEFITVRGETTPGYYIYNWEQIGVTDIDLSNYYTKGQADSKFATSTDLQQGLATRQPLGDYVTNSQLSSYVKNAVVTGYGSESVLTLTMKDDSIITFPRQQPSLDLEITGLIANLYCHWDEGGTSVFNETFYNWLSYTRPDGLTNLQIIGMIKESLSEETGEVVGHIKVTNTTFNCSYENEEEETISGTVVGTGTNYGISFDDMKCIIDNNYIVCEISSNNDGVFKKGTFTSSLIIFLQYSGNKVGHISLQTAY